MAEMVADRAKPRAGCDPARSGARARLRGLRRLRAEPQVSPACHRGDPRGTRRAHQGLQHRHHRLRARRPLRPAARLDRPHRGGPPPPVAGALLPDQRPRRSGAGSASPRDPTFPPSRPASAEPVEPADAVAPRTTLGPALLVAAFDEEGDAAAFPGFTRGFARALVVALTRFTTLRVFDAEAANLPGASAHGPASGARRRLHPHRRHDGRAGPLRGRRRPGGGAHRPLDLGATACSGACSRRRSSRCATRSPTRSCAPSPSPTASSTAPAPATPTARRRRASAATAACCASTSTGGPSTATSSSRFGTASSAPSSPSRNTPRPSPACRWSTRTPDASRIRTRATRTSRGARARPRASGGRTRAGLELGAVRAGARLLVHRRRRPRPRGAGDRPRAQPERHHDHRRPRAALCHARGLGPGGAAAGRGLRPQPGAAGHLSDRHVSLSLCPRALRGGARRGAQRRRRARGLRLDRHRRGRGDARAHRARPPPRSTPSWRSTRATASVSSRTCRRATWSRGCCKRSSMGCGWPACPAWMPGPRAARPSRRSWGLPASATEAEGWRLH